MKTKKYIRFVRLFFLGNYKHKNMKKYIYTFTFFLSLFVSIASTFGQLQGIERNNPVARWSSSDLYGKYTQAQELSGARTRISKTFKNTDGTNTIIFGGLTHYKDANGAWQEVDFSIAQNNSGNHRSTHSFSNQTNEIKSYYPSAAGSNGIIIQNGQKELNWWKNPSVQLTDASDNKIIQRNATTNSGSVNSNSISYQTYPGISDHFVVEEKGIENNIIISSFDSLKNNSASVLSFSQFISIPTGWNVYINDNVTTSDFSAPSFVIKQSANEDGFVFNPIVAFDNNIKGMNDAFELLTNPKDRLTPAQSQLLKNNIIQGTYKVKFVKGGIELSYVLPYSWFANQNRNFPVTIDPAVTIGSQTTGYNVILWDGYYCNTRLQCLYTSSDLINAGLSNNDIITAIGVNASTVQCGSSNYTGLKIRLKSTSATTSSTFDNSSYTNCYSGSQNISATGWYTHNFGTNFTFNSANNVLVDYTMNLTGGYLCLSNHNYWWSWNAGTNRSCYNATYSSCSTDPQTWTGGNAWTYVPYTQITYCTTPSISSQPSNATICAGASANFSVTAAGTSLSYQWKYWNGSSYVNVANATPTGATYSNATTATMTVSGITSASTYTYNCYVSNGCGNVTSNSKTLTLNSNPTVSASPSSTSICNGASANLTASGASTYAWSPSTGLNSTTGATVTANPTATTTYTVTGTNSNGCTNTATSAVTILPLPSLTITPSSATLCRGSSTTLTASGASTYAWSPSTGLNSTTGTTVTANPTTTTTYTITGTGSNGCTNTKTAVVTINAIPSVSVSPSNPTVCTGGNTTITASGATTYAWSPSTALNTTTGATVISTPTANITYTVTGTTSGCSGTATSAVIFQNINGGTASASGGSDVCSNSAVSLSLTGLTGTFVKWQSSTDNVTYADIPGGTTQSFSTSVNTSTYFRAQVTNGSCTAYSSAAHYITNNNYYVNDNSTSGDIFTSAVGSSGNDGKDPSRPKASINDVFATYTIGHCDTIFVDKGTYSEEVDIFSTDGGNSSGYATVIGAGVNNTVLNAPANSHNFYLGTNYMKIQDMAMNNTNLSYYNVEIYEAAHNIITGTKLSHTADANVVIFGDAINSNGNQISNNTINNSSSATSTGIYNGIFVEGNCDSLIVKNNTITMSNANTIDAILITTYYDGINNYYPSAGNINQNTISAYTYGVSLWGYDYPIATYTVSSNNITMQSNATTDGAPVWLGSVGANSAAQSLIYGNRLIGGKSGIYIAFSTNYEKIYNNYISGNDNGINVPASSSTNGELYFNSFFNTTNNLFFTSYSYTSWKVKDNIFYTTSSSSSNACINLGGGTYFNACDYNLFYNPNGASVGIISSTNYSTLNAWKNVQHTSTSPNGDQNSKSGNPLYANASSNNLDITSSSPASVAGTTISGITKDIYNTTRTNPPSIGADEAAPIPSISVAPSTTICSGTSATLTANAGGGTGQTYVWSPGGATTSAITVNPTSTTTYSVQVNYSGGYSATVTQTITVNPAPVVNAGSSRTICIGASVTFNSSVSSGTSPFTYSWSPSASLSNSTSLNPVATPTTTTTYSLTVTDSKGCMATATNTVTVSPLPSPTVTASPSFTICLGHSTTLTANGGTSYSWNTGVTTSTLAVSPTITTTYFVIVTNSSGCTATVREIVTVNPLPFANAGSNATICIGSNTTLNGSASGGPSPYTYSWSPSASLNNSTSANPVASPTNNTSYTLTVTNALGCSSSNAVNISVDNPHVNADSALATFLTGGLPSATGGVPPYTFVWAPAASSNNPLALPDTATTFTLTVTDANGCSSRDTANFVPSTNIAPSCGAIFISEYVQDTVNNDNAIEIYNPTGSAINLNGYFLMGTTNGSIFAPPFIIQLSGSIAAHKTFVIAKTHADTALTNKADMLADSLNFRGLDVVILAGIFPTSSAVQFNLLDKIGDLQTLPSDSGWVVSSGSTKNHTLIRKISITKGNTNWTTCQNEWNVYPQGTFNYLKHFKNVCTPGDPDITFSLDNATTNCGNPSYFEFDIMGQADAPTIFNNCVIDFQYPISEFAGDDVSNGGVVVSQGSDCQSGAGNDYNILSAVNLSSNVVEITFGAASQTSPNGTVLYTNPKALIHVQLKIQNCQDSSVAFVNSASAYYTEKQIDQLIPDSSVSGSYQCNPYPCNPYPCDYDTSCQCYLNTCYQTCYQTCYTYDYFYDTTFTYNSVQYSNTNFSNNINSIACPVSIDNVTPSINGGTNAISVPSNSSLLTITGSGFGNSLGSILVPDANLSSTSPTIILDDADIEYWSENKIEVKMPSTIVGNSALTPGSGSLQVNNNCSSNAFDNNLQIHYSIKNDIFSSAPNEKLRVNIVQEPSQVAGSYIFYCDTSVSHNPQAYACVKKAIVTWNCNTGVNWTMAGEAIVTSSMENNSDGISYIFFSDNFPPSSSAAMITNRHTLNCTDLTDSFAFNNDADIRMRITLGNVIPGLVWNYDTTALDTLAANEISFYDALLHELGHAHLLQHVNNVHALMDASVTAGGIRKDILSGTETLAGAMDVINTSVATLPNNSCGYSVIFVAPGSNCNPIGSGVPNILQNEYNFNIFPNPANQENIIVSYQLNKNAFVQFKIVDYTGRNVMLLDDEKKSAGTYSEHINISQLAEGIYLFIANINGEYQTIKLIKL